MRAGERPPAAELATQQRHPRRLVQREVIGFDPGHRQQLGHDALVHVGILAQVERGEMEAECLNRAHQPVEPGAPACAEPGAQLREIGAEGGRIGIGFGLGPRRAGRRPSCQRAIGRRQSCVDARQRAAVGLVRTGGRVVAARFGQRLYFGRDRRQLARDRELGAERVDELEIMAEHRLGGAPGRQR